MSTAASPQVAPIARRADEGEALWFLGALATVKAAAGETDGRVSVVDFVMPRGHGSPLHVHTREDEWFSVLEGEVTFWIEGVGRVVATEGAFIYGPRMIPHTFEVTSEVARMTVVTEPGGFEDFLRAAGAPATERVLAPPDIAPPDPATLGAIAAQHGIDILGPPGIPA
ncbi:MAG TPA: quercetin 2,3-dioxygenase [Baekduia sp.]|nr:quercetin 2,3-dioxygenase [Baekduia sp.]